MQLRAEMVERIGRLPLGGWSLGGCAGAVLPTPRLSVCAWAEEVVVLGPRVSSEPGPLRLERTPYMREVLEAFADPEVKEITIKSSTQVAKSTMLHVMSAYAADVDPGPMLWILPTEDVAQEINEEKLVPIFEDSPRLRRHLPRGRGLSRSRLRLTSLDMHFAWPRSAIKLASKSKRYVIADEVDKYPARTGKEADPISLARERQRTYTAGCKLVQASTPTDADGPIERAYQRSDKAVLQCRCLRCGEYQALSHAQIRWPKGEVEGMRAPRPSEIRSKRLAWYECAHCGGRMEEREKAQFVSTGVFCPSGCSLRGWSSVDEARLHVGRLYGQESRVQQGRRVGEVGGHAYSVEGELPGVTHRGFWFNCVASPWLSFSDIAYEWLDSQGDLLRLQNFVNSWAAELWHHETVEHDAGRLRGLVREYRRGEVPCDESVLVLGIDKQKEHLWFVVRAYDKHGQSWLVEWGRLDRQHNEAGVMTSHELSLVDEAVVRRAWRSVGGRPVSLVGGFIDSRYDGDAVLRWVRGHRTWMRASQGSPDRMLLPLHKVEWDPRHGRGKNVRYALDYYRVNTEHFKDLLAGRIADGGAWYVPEDVGHCADYERQLFAEHKALVVGKREDRWMLRPGQRDNHLWDCEVLCEASAFLLGIGKGGALPRGGVDGGGGGGAGWAEKVAALRGRRGRGGRSG